MLTLSSTASKRNNLETESSPEAECSRSAQSTCEKVEISKCDSKTETAGDEHVEEDSKIERDANLDEKLKLRIVHVCDDHVPEMRDLENCRSSVHRVPLLEDPTLPNGWTRKVKHSLENNLLEKICVQVFPRKGKESYYTIIVDPQGGRFRSRQDLRRHFEKTNEAVLQWQDFDFNPYGSKKI